VSVYVDNLRSWGWKLRGRQVESCHMIADTLEELHAMAGAIGAKHEWFQPTSFPHYDLTASRRASAVYYGAIEVGRREFVAHMRRLRAGLLGGKPR